MFISNKFDNFVEIIFILVFIKILIINLKYLSILLFNEKRIRMKRFRNFENISDKEYDFIQIEYGSVFKSSSKTVYKVSRIESLEDAKNNIKFS